MSSIQGVGSTPMIDPAALKGMDLETAMLVVQSQRANTLEDGLKIKMEAVANRNKGIAELNKTISALNNATSTWKGDDKNSINATMNAPTGDVKPQVNENKQALKDQLTNAQADLKRNEWMKTSFWPWDKSNYAAKVATVNDLQTKFNNEPAMRAYANKDVFAQYGVAPLSGDVTKAQVDAKVKELQTKVDELNSSQQMDMLSLQSMMNKRNEAFDLMTNFVKKMADSRSSIIGNMR